MARNLRTPGFTCKQKQKKWFILLVIQIILVGILVHLAFNNNQFTHGSKAITDSSSNIFRASELDRKTRTDLENEDIDVHREGIAHVHHEHKSDRSLPTVAIGLALTSEKVYNVTQDNLRYKFLFFRSLLPSFCKTSTQGYSYHFYIAYDAADPFFNRPESFKWFTNVFIQFRRDICSYVSDMQLHLIQCTHSKKPAWAQNDAMMEAYLDDIDYYYRVNDDTMMKSAGWTEAYISTLKGFDPPNIGAVGPTETRDKPNILTYDFVHRTHIDIFGFYYPRLFTDWFADDWITSVYQPNRSVKISQVKVLHTQLLGTRYENRFSVAQYLKFQVDNDIRQLKWYLESILNNNSIMKDSSRVIAMELPNLDMNYIYGALRNAHLANRFLPDWSVYIYVSQCNLPPRIMHKFNQTGANLIFCDLDRSEEMPSVLKPFSVADNKNVKHFVVRDALARITNRDAHVIRHWVNHNAPFLCIRDHPYIHSAPLTPGLFGAKADSFVDALTSGYEDTGRNLTSLLESFSSSFSVHEPHNFSQTYTPYSSYNTSRYRLESHFLNDHVWPKIKQNVVCYDSVHCDGWRANGKVQDFPTPREDYEFVGEHFGAYERPIDFNATSVFHSYERTCDT